MNVCKHFGVFKLKGSLLRQVAEDSSPVRLSRTLRRAGTSQGSGGASSSESQCRPHWGAGPADPVTAFASWSAKVFHHLIGQMLWAFLF